MTPEREQLSRLQVFLLTFASGIVVANAYYIHPIISMIAEAFEISDGMIGIVPAFNQLALAAGILLMLPLGDMVSNKSLTAIFVSLQTLAVAAMAFAPGFIVFLTASTLLGFVTIVPYLLPAYVSKRVPANSLGYVTALLTTGVIIGILVARAGAGIVAEYLGWRPVYMIAALLMLCMSIVLPLVMDGGERARERVSAKRYFALLGSIFPIVRQYPRILLSGCVQGLGFGTFLVTWMGIGLHLPSEEMGYGVDVVGYLALLAIVSMVTTPRFGRWADRFGARRARLVLASLQLSSMILFLFVGQSLWWMIIPIMLTNMFGPSIDVTGRMTFLSLSADIRTRLMTVYIVMMFVGGGIGSWAGTASYAWSGWVAMAGVAVFMSSLMTMIAAYDWWLDKKSA